MIAKYMRFIVVNSLDQTLTYDSDARIEVTYNGYKFVDGVKTWLAEVKHNTVFLDTGESLTAAAQSIGTVIDDSSNLLVGMLGTFRVIADQTSSDGTVYLYKEESTDNTVWPSDGADWSISIHAKFVAALAMTTDAGDEDAMVNFEL